MHKQHPAHEVNHNHNAANQEDDRDADRNNKNTLLIFPSLIAGSPNSRCASQKRHHGQGHEGAVARDALGDLPGAVASVEHRAAGFVEFHGAHAF